MLSRRTTIMTLLAAAAVSSTEAATATRKTNTDLIRRYFDVWNSGRLDDLDTLLSADYVNHTPSTPNPPRGPAGLKPIIESFRVAFPDLRFTIEDIITTDSHAVARVEMRGTHRGDLFGIAPTGRSVAVNQINIERIEREQIIEHWRVTDELALMRQLGVVAG